MRRPLRIALIAADALLAVLFLAGYMAYFVRPTVFWWFELAAVFLPYLAVLVAVAAVLLLVFRQWGLAALHGILIVLILVRMNPFDRFDGGTVADGETLSVLTFNVPRWWGYEMPAKTVEMAKFVRRADPDVMALQEADIVFFKDERGRRADPYVSILYDSLGYDTIGPESDGHTWTPQPVLSRHPLVRQEEFRLARIPGDSTDLLVTRAEIRWKDQPFALYNVHLRTFGDRKPWRDEPLPFVEPRTAASYLRQYRDAYRLRAWEVEEIVKMIEREDMPVVLCGDLNSTPNNWVHARLSKVLRDAFAEKGVGWGMTYHTRLPIFRIDYVFVSEEWDVVSARVLDAYLSDHLPMVVELRLRD